MGLPLLPETLPLGAWLGSGRASCNLFSVAQRVAREMTGLGKPAGPKDRHGWRIAVITETEFPSWVGVRAAMWEVTVLEGKRT